MKFVVDTASLNKGFRDYGAAVDGVFAKLDQFEAHVNKTMKSVAKAATNKGDIAKFKKSFDELGNIKIDGTAARKMTALSSAMNGFKAPSAAQSANMRTFFRAFTGMPDLTSAYKNIKAIDNLNIAMRGFQAPAAAQAKRLTEFATAMATAAPKLKGLGAITGLAHLGSELGTLGNALKNLKVPSSGQITNLGNMALALKQFNFANLGHSANLYATLGALGNFKAPSAAATRNLENFINAVGRMKVPGNGATMARFLQQIASASSLASANMGKFGGMASGIPPHLTRIASGAKSASLQMAGLQNAFNGTFQVGSLLRSLLGSLTIGELGREFFKATNAAIAFRSQMSVVSKETGFANLQLGYIQETANKFGVDVNQAESGFAKLSIAAKKSGGSVQQTRQVFEGFSGAMTVLGTSTERQGDVWLALQQVLNKGYLSSEELNQQLNEQLPGAMSYASEMAAKLGMNLQDALKKKLIGGLDAATYFAKRFKEDFGPSLAQALERPSAQMNILKNNLNALYVKIGDSGATAGFSGFLQTINTALDPATVNNFAMAVGQGLKSALDSATAAFQWLYTNWDSIKGPLTTTLKLLGEWMIMSAALNIGRSIVAPLIAMRMGLIGVVGQLGALKGAGGIFSGLTAGTKPLLTGLASLNVGAQASTVGFNALKIAGNGVRGVFGGVASLFGGPVGLALVAAAAGVAYVASGIMEMNATLASVQPTINSTNALLNTLGLHSLTAATNTKALSTQHASAVKPINDFAGATGNAAQQLWNMAAAQRAANIAAITGKLNTMQGQRDSIYQNSAMGLADDGQKKVKSVGQFASYLGKGVTLAADYAISGGTSEDDKIAKLHKLDSALQQTRAELKTYQAQDLKTEVNDAMRTIVAPPPAAIPRIESKKKKHGPTEAQKLATLENGIDSMMAKLLAGDPMKELYVKFVGVLSDEGRALLSDKSFKTFAANLGADMDSGKVSVQGLIDALQSGGMRPKVLDDLKKRYSTDTQGIIKMLKAQQEDYDQSLIDATAKTIDSSMKSIDGIMAKLAEDDPVLKVRVDFISDITSEAMKSLNGEAFTKLAPTLIGLRDGSISAKQATDALLDSLANGGKKIGISQAWIDLLSKSLGNSQSAFEHNDAEAKKAANVVENYMKKEREALALAGLSNDAQEIALKLQELVNAAHERKKDLTAAEIANARTQLEQLKASNDLLAKQKTLFENNGLRMYNKDTIQTADLVNNLDKTTFQGLEDTLFSLGKTGKLSFKSMLDGIQDEILHYASKGLSQQIMNLMVPGASKDIAAGGSPSLWSKMFGGAKTMDAKNYKDATDISGQFGGNSFTIDPVTRGLLVSIVGDSTAAGAAATTAGGATAVGLDGKQIAAPGLTAIGATADPTKTIETATVATASKFQESMGMVIPMVGMAFASSFKSPIAQVGAMFLSMMLSKMVQSGGSGGGGGGGGFMGTIMGLFGGGGGGGITSAMQSSSLDMIAANPGIFKEGGFTSSPVARGSMSASHFVNAPHYADGTPNTSGGHPAVLHDNEAVIPLTRGRKVAVELAQGGSGGRGGDTVVNNNYTINSPDADSFRKSRQQIVTDMHMQASRAYARNH